MKTLRTTLGILTLGAAISAQAQENKPRPPQGGPQRGNPGEVIERARELSRALSVRASRTSMLVL